MKLFETFMPRESSKSSLLEKSQIDYTFKNKIAGSESIDQENVGCCNHFKDVLWVSLFRSWNWTTGD